MEDWKNDLQRFFKDRGPEAPRDNRRHKRLEESRPEVYVFLGSIVMRAFAALQFELQKYGRLVSINQAMDSATLTVRHNMAQEFQYAIRVKSEPHGSYPFPEMHRRSMQADQPATHSEPLRAGNQGYTITDITREEIIQHFLLQYKQSGP